DNIGATWTAEGTAEFGDQLATASKMVLALGSYGGGAQTVVYGTIVNSDRTVTTMVRSGDGGDHWSLYGFPSDVETFKQGKAAMAADPTSARTFYIGGDEGATDRCAVDGGGNLTSCTHISDADGTANNTHPHADSRAMAF